MDLSTGGPTCCHRPRPLYAEQGGEGYERLTGVDFNPLRMPGAVVRADHRVEPQLFAFAGGRRPSRCKRTNHASLAVSLLIFPDPTTSSSSGLLKNSERVSR
jgi:hypothetical protein